MTTDEADAPTVDWLGTQPLALREGVELITGAGGRTMLVSPAGKYVNVSASGMAVVRLLDGEATGAQVIDGLCLAHPDNAAQLHVTLRRFLVDLRQGDVLTVEPLARSTKEKFTRLGAVDPVKRFSLVADPARLVAPVVRLLMRVRVRVLVATLLAIPVVAVPLVGVALVGHPMTHRPSGWAMVLMVVVMATQVVVHETCHAVAMAYNGVRAKSAGVGLLFWFMPVAFVDRTNSYRHQGRAGRALISLVGPLCDTFFAGVWSIAAMTTHGPASAFFGTLLLLQVFAVLANVNMLFPSDGYHALEAALGSINMRGRALTYVLRAITRSPQPSYLTVISGRAKVGYVTYVVLSSLYTALILAFMVINIVLVLSRAVA